MPTNLHSQTYAGVKEDSVPRQRHSDGRAKQQLEEGALFVLVGRMKLIQIVNEPAMGPSYSQEDLIREQYEVVKVREDGSMLLKHRKTREEFALRHVGSNSEEEMLGFMDLLGSRQKVKSPNLLSLQQIKKEEQKQVCSMLHKIYLLMEYPFKTLQDEIDEKISERRKEPFSEAELWSILYSCCMGMHQLYSHKITHECLTSSQIFINKEGLIKIADPLILGLEKNYITVMKKTDDTAHISPEIINFLDDCNFSFYDKEKSDVFVLGMIMLEAALLQPIVLYDKKVKRPHLDKIPPLLKSVKGRYSHQFVEVLTSMLQMHSKQRPKFMDIIASVEEENTMCIEEADAKSKNQSNQQATKNTSMGALPKYIPPFSSPEKSNSYSSNNQGTIISQLNSASFKVNPANPGFNSNNGLKSLPFALQSSDKSHQSQSYFYQNQQPWLNQQQGLNQQPTFRDNQPTQFNSYSVNSSARKDERFSYNKFAAIDLNKNQAYSSSISQAPIFSSEIPGIKDLLNDIKSSMKKNPSANFTQPSQFNYQSPSYSLNQSNSLSYLQQPLTASNSFNQTISFTGAAHKTFDMHKQSTIPSYDSSGVAPKSDLLPISMPSTIKMEEKSLVKNKWENEGLKNAGDSHRRQKDDSLDLPRMDIQFKQTFIEPLTNLVENDQSQTKHRSPVQAKQAVNQGQQAKYVCLMLEGGGKYEGFMKGGMKNGEGRLQFKDGGYYTGEWRNNKMNGYGKLHYENGRIAYEGNWQDDEFYGFGRVFNDQPESLMASFNYYDFADLGNKWVYYEGEFKSDSKHGKGKIKLTNGEVFEGTFVQDTIEGSGVFYSISGEAIRGIWKDNILLNDG